MMRKEICRCFEIIFSQLELDLPFRAIPGRNRNSLIHIRNHTTANLLWNDATIRRNLDYCNTMSIDSRQPARAWRRARWGLCRRRAWTSGPLSRPFRRHRLTRTVQTFLLIDPCKRRASIPRWKAGPHFSAVCRPREFFHIISSIYFFALIQSSNISQSRAYLIANYRDRMNRISYGASLDRLWWNLKTYIFREAVVSWTAGVNSLP